MCWDAKLMGIERDSWKFPKPTLQTGNVCGAIMCGKFRN